MIRKEFCAKGILSTILKSNKMKKSQTWFLKIFIMAVILGMIPLYAVSGKYTILLSGASFANEPNGWFELGCERLGATPLNRAIGGEAIANTANRMKEGTLYSAEELEMIDAFVIMQVHNRDVGS